MPDAPIGGFVVVNYTLVFAFERSRLSPYDLDRGAH